jgi:protein-disulfide isomerase
MGSAQASSRGLAGIRAAALVLPILAGLSASAALLVDYTRNAPVFCAEGGGCEAVKRTVFAAPGHVPLPLFGLLGFLLLALLAMLRGSVAERLHCAAAVVGGIFALGLISVQATLGQYCVYCMTVDIATCLAAVVAIWRVRGEWDLEAGTGARASLGAVLAVVPAGVLALGFAAKVRLPALIAEEIGRGPKGTATVVEFVDFECPFCRDEYADLAPMLETQKDRVRVVRKLVPLTKIHPHALEAARAACCGEMLGQGDAMADALFRAPIDELTEAGCQRIATDLGLDPARYAQCLADPKTARRIASDREDFDRTAIKGVDGLPLLWIGERKLMGIQAKEALERALDQAIGKAGS